MQNHREGDRICIFGFSRGAYTARALAGMLHKVGLLPSNNQAQLSFAYQWYADESQRGWDMSADFKSTFSVPVEVAFLGCWDTVASVGLYSTTLPFAKNNKRAVVYFRHAIALDERRIKFLPTRWGKEGRNNARYTPLQGHVVDKARKLANDRGHHYAKPLSLLDMTINPFVDFLTGIQPSFSKACKLVLTAQMAVVKMLYCILLDTIISPVDHAMSLMGLRGDEQQYNTWSGLIAIAQIVTLWIAILFRRVDNYLWRTFFFDSKKQKQEEDKFDETLSASECSTEDSSPNILEVFFAGEHADCGGGTVANVERNMASRIALRWMIRQTFECNAYIHYRTEILAEHGLDVDTLWPRYTFRQPMLEPFAFDVNLPPKLLSAKETRKAMRTRIVCDPRPDNNSLLGFSQRRYGLGSSPQSLAGMPMSRTNSSLSPYAATLSPETMMSELSRNSDASTNATSISAESGTVKLDGAQPNQSPLSCTIAISKPLSITPLLVPAPFSSIEDAEDHMDALSPLHDQLLEQKLWWLLELFPLRFRTKLPNGSLSKVRAPHLGRHRAVTDMKPLMHHTVVLRLNRGPYRLVNPIEDDADWQVVA
jgi:hypothetical protein